MKYKCKKCGEEYPYEPVFCNDCGTRFSIENFKIVNPVEPKIYTNKETYDLLTSFKKDFPLHRNITISGDELKEWFEINKKK